MLKGIYIVPDSGNFGKKGRNAESGSDSHITMGIKQLRTHFDIIPYILDEGNQQLASKPDKESAAVSKGVDTNKFKGLLRDIGCLVKNHVHFFKHYRALKKEKPDFIYERSEYLNLNGVIIARLLKIPHFYEGNWIHYQGVQQFYLSHFNGKAKKIEEWMYNWSTHSFFIGNQNKYLNLKDGKWSVIQNGVADKIIEKFRAHQNVVNSGLIRFCVLASLMPHHRFDILTEGLRQLDQQHKEKIELHLIGFNFEPILNTIPPDINYIHHGPMGKEEIYSLLPQLNVALISGGPQYSSFMKLYDYAAAKMAVICPGLENMIMTFGSDEILFFENENSQSLAQQVRRVIENPELIKSYGETLYNKVKGSFTWEKIFEGVSVQILNFSKNGTD